MTDFKPPIVSVSFSHRPGRVLMTVDLENALAFVMPLEIPVAHALSEAFLASSKVSPGITIDRIPAELFPGLPETIVDWTREPESVPPSAIGVRKLVDGSTALGLTWNGPGGPSVFRAQIAGDPGIIANLILAQCAHAQGKLTGYGGATEVA